METDKEKIHITCIVESPHDGVDVVKFRDNWRGDEVKKGRGKGLTTRQIDGAIYLAGIKALSK